MGLALKWCLGWLFGFKMHKKNVFSWGSAPDPAIAYDAPQTRASRMGRGRTLLPLDAFCASVLAYHF